jgi:hypothetical protein
MPVYRSKQVFEVRSMRVSAAEAHAALSITEREVLFTDVKWDG